MKRFLLLAVTLLVAVAVFGIAPAPHPAAQAQSPDEAETRVDQALEHLTGWINADTPLTRGGDLRWFWAYNAYGSSALDCPADGYSYIQQQTFAYQIDIVLDNGAGPSFDYRVSQDGSILVLCGADGSPLFRTDTPVESTPGAGTQPATPGTAPVVADFVSLPQSQWLAMTYTQAQDRLYFLNENGEIGSIARPRSAEEAFAPGTQTPRYMAASPSGRYLVQRVERDGGGEILSVHDLERGTLVYSEAILSPDIFPGGSSLFVDAAPAPFFDNQEQRFVFTRFDGSFATGWTVTSVDLSGQGNTATLTDEDFVALSANLDVPVARANELTYYPDVVYVDPLGIVHLQLVPGATQPPLEYEAIAWDTNTNTLSLSPYTQDAVYVLPASGVALYPGVDPNTTIAQPRGPVPRRNALYRGVPIADTLNESLLFSNPFYLFFNALPASVDGNTVAVALLEPEAESVWALWNANSGAEPSLLPAEIESLGGIDGGVVALVADEGPGTVLQLGFFDAATIWSAPPQQGNVDLVWVQPPGRNQTLTDVTGSSSPTAAPTGIQNCPGTVASQVSIGERARVTFTDGTPLRLRDGPGTTATFLQDLPEGTSFEIIGGPVCADGFTWWNVQLADGTQGWSAEGDDDSYFMEPLP